MVEPQSIASNLNAILEIAEDCYIKDLRIFGKHINQPFEWQTALCLILIPVEEKMTVWHRRAFNERVTLLLKNGVQSYTPNELTENLVNTTLITREQAKEYLENSINLETYVNDYVKKPSTDNTAKEVQSPEKMKLTKQ